MSKLVTLTLVSGKEIAVNPDAIAYGEVSADGRVTLTMTDKKEFKIMASLVNLNKLIEKSQSSPSIPVNVQVTYPEETQARTVTRGKATKES